MKDKEKQIEEMARIIELGCANEECTEKCKYRNEEPYLCYSKLCADKIYNLFYPKDSVVLSKKEYERLKLARDICCHDLFTATKQSHEEGYKRGYDKGKYEGSKETAEKIYLQAKAIVGATKYIVQGREYLHIDALKEIVKSCGVEIKE